MRLWGNRPSARRLALLQWEVRSIQAFLDEFEGLPSRMRCARLAAAGEAIIIRNFPLPDRYQPDYIDLLIALPDYPARPPIGFYVLNQANGALIIQLKDRFNAFRDRAFHEAEALPGYTWICYAYADNLWRYRPDSPSQGDNVRKFLASFLANLEV